MDDLSNYRSRIGMFSSNKQPNRKTYSNTSCTGTFAYTLAFLLVIALSAQVAITDPSIELNPGPTPTDTNNNNIVSSANIVRSTTNKLRTVVKDIARISSHRFFLQSCIDLQLTPRGLTVEPAPNVCAFPTENLSKALQAAQKKFTKENINIIITHYNSMLANLRHQNSSLIEELRNITTNEAFENIIIELDNSFPFC